MSASIFQCEDCASVYEGEDGIGPCGLCGGTSKQVPFRSGYDRPHMLEQYVRAHHLEAATTSPGGGQSAIEETLHWLQNNPEGWANEDYLRYLLAAVSLRVSELDYEKGRS